MLKRRTTNQSIEVDVKIIGFIQLLEDYRGKCETEKNYMEAKKAHTKIQEIIDKEALRQKNHLQRTQEQEIQNLEAQQKAQFIRKPILLRLCFYWSLTVCSYSPGQRLR